MKKLFVITFVFICINTFATHIAGGNITYQYVGNNSLGQNQFIFTLDFYRDCEGINVPSNQELDIIVNNSIIGHIDLELADGFPILITNTCNDSITTTCTDTSSDIEGTQLYRYISMPIPFTPSIWTIAFSSFDRDDGITNGGQNAGFFISTMLNNFVQVSSSPSFNNTPILNACVNQEFNFNNGVVPSNPNNSISYQLITPFTNIGNTITYESGFSPNYPISTVDNVVNFNSITGQISFTPDEAQIGIVSFLISEINPNNEIISTVIRDIQIIVNNDCENSDPNIDSLTNLFNVTPNEDTTILTVCSGDSIYFQINGNDDDIADLLKFSSTNINLLPNNAIISQDTPSNPMTAFFSWNTNGVPVGNYPITFLLEDNHCPTKGTSSINYIIEISTCDDTVAITNTVLGCNTIQLSAIPVSNNGAFTYVWTGPGIVQGQGTNTIIVSSVGTYTVTVNRNGIFYDNEQYIVKPTNLNIVTKDVSTDITEADYANDFIGTCSCLLSNENTSNDLPPSAPNNSNLNHLAQSASISRNSWFAFEMPATGQIQVILRSGSVSGTSYGSIIQPIMTLWRLNGGNLEQIESRPLVSEQKISYIGIPDEVIYVSVSNITLSFHGTFTICMYDYVGNDLIQGAVSLPVNSSDGGTLINPSNASTNISYPFRPALSSSPHIPESDPLLSSFSTVNAAFLHYMRPPTDATSSQFGINVDGNNFFSLTPTSAPIIPPSINRINRSVWFTFNADDINEIDITLLRGTINGVNYGTIGAPMLSLWEWNDDGDDIIEETEFRILSFRDYRYNPAGTNRMRLGYPNINSDNRYFICVSNSIYDADYGYGGTFSLRLHNQVTNDYIEGARLLNISDFTFNSGTSSFLYDPSLTTIPNNVNINNPNQDTYLGPYNLSNSNNFIVNNALEETSTYCQNSSHPAYTSSYNLWYLTNEASGINGIKLPAIPTVFGAPFYIRVWQWNDNNNDNIYQSGELGGFVGGSCRINLGGGVFNVPTYNGLNSGKHIIAIGNTTNFPSVGPFQMEVSSVALRLNTTNFSTTPSTFAIYPNPTSTQLTVELPVVEGSAYTIKIYDMNGKVCKELSIGDSKLQIDVSELPSGIYSLQAQNGATLYNEKVVIER